MCARYALWAWACCFDFVGLWWGSWALEPESRSHKHTVHSTNSVCRRPTIQMYRVPMHWTTAISHVCSIADINLCAPCTHMISNISKMDIMQVPIHRMVHVFGIRIYKYNETPAFLSFSISIENRSCVHRPLNTWMQGTHCRTLCAPEIREGEGR